DAVHQEDRHRRFRLAHGIEESVLQVLLFFAHGFAHFGSWPRAPRNRVGSIRRFAAGAKPYGFLKACNSPIRRVSGPGLPVPTGTPSIATTGTAAPDAEEMKASRACLASAGVKARSTTGTCASAAASRITRRVTPGRIAFDNARVMTRPSASTIQAVVEAPSVTKPSR